MNPASLCIPTVCPPPTLAALLSLTDGLLIGGLLLIVASLLFSIRGRRRKTESHPTVDEEIERRRQARGLRGDLEQIMVEIEQLAKRMSAQLDAKAMHVEMLLRETDQKIEQLKRLQSDRGHSDTPADTAAVGSATGDEPASDEQDGIARSVYALADTGLDASQIARKLEEHVGKVELILALRDG